MRAEDLKEWCKKAKREKEPVGRRWELVVRLVQVMFRVGTEGRGSTGAYGW